MTQVIAYIPSGFSNQDKSKYLNGIKDILSKTINEQSNIYIEEYRPEDACPNGADKMAIIIYTTTGKPDDKKEEIAKLYDSLCTDVFRDKRLGAFITFEEHTTNNVCVNGVLASNDE